MGHVGDLEGKKFKDAARGDLELGSRENEADKKGREEALKESKDLLKRVKDALGDRVQEVRTSVRLRESPACLVLGEHDMGASMRRILSAAGQKVPESKPVLEINTGHSIVKYLDSVTDAGQFNELAQLLYDQALLAEGGQLPNPADYVQRLNRLLVRLAGVSETAAASDDSAK